MKDKKYKSPFVINDPVIPPIFAGRKEELNYIYNALFEDKESLVIYGNDAIGKSSIVRTIYRELQNSKETAILPVKIDAFYFIQGIEQDFLSALTHHICSEIWTGLMKRKLSELIEDTISNVRSEKLKGSEEKTIKRIYKIVTSENLIGKGTLNKELGVKFYAEGKITQSNELVNKRKPLTSFEFLHLLDELIDIIKSYEYESIMVFCDELNHLPEKVNSEVLRNYFSLFSSKKIQFMTVVVNPEQKYIQDAKKLIEAYNYSLEIKPFGSVQAVKELICNTLKQNQSGIELDKEIDKYLFEVTSGHPWWVQKICNTAFNRTFHKNLQLITLPTIEQAYESFEKEIAIYNERTKSGLPFRKYNLK